MNKKVKIIIMDDVHIEGRSQNQIVDFQNNVKSKIEAAKELNQIPIVVCAGDIGEGTTGIEWAKEFDCDVLYTCGNHEFWNRDYFQTYKDIYEKLKNPEYKNIHFLNNNVFELHGIRFIGGTMWTNVGNFLNWYENKNLSLKYFTVMGDFKKITLKGWYTTENIKKLKSFMASNISQMNQVVESNILSLIENEYFNPLFELEIHEEAKKFIESELSKPFDGKTIVITHHLPDFNLWAKAKKMNVKVLEGEYLNNDRLLLEGAKGNNKMYRDAMLIGFYSNNLKNLMFGKLAPDYWIHGHLHIPIHTVIGKTKVVSSPVGYNSQSNEMKMKEILVDNKYTFFAEAIRKNVEEYAWEENLVKTLNDYEKSIKLFEPLIQSNFISGLEFKIIFNQFKMAHQQNVNQLKKDLVDWLSPLVDTSYENKEQDYFNVILKSGILFSKTIATNGEEIKFKLPDYITAEIGNNSFKEDEGNEAKNTHLKYWKSEINKILLQIKNLKKLILVFVNDLEEKER